VIVYVAGKFIEIGIIHDGQINATRIQVAKSAIGCVVMLHECAFFNNSEISARHHAKAHMRFPRE
jgi:hypothetical protein